MVSRLLNLDLRHNLTHPPSCLSGLESTINARSARWEKSPGATPRYLLRRFPPSCDVQGSKLEFEAADEVTLALTQPRPRPVLEDCIAFFFQLWLLLATQHSLPWDSILIWVGPRWVRLLTQRSLGLGGDNSCTFGATVLLPFTM